MGRRTGATKYIIFLASRSIILLKFEKCRCVCLSANSSAVYGPMGTKLSIRDKDIISFCWWVSGWEPHWQGASNKNKTKAHNLFTPMWPPTRPLAGSYSGTGCDTKGQLWWKAGCWLVLEGPPPLDRHVSGTITKLHHPFKGGSSNSRCQKWGDHEIKTPSNCRFPCRFNRGDHRISCVNFA